jgi:hypothetical protein
LRYVALDPEFATVLEDHPEHRQHRLEFRRAGLNLAAHALAVLRSPAVVARARQSPHRRVRALLDTIGDAE